MKRQWRIRRQSVEYPDGQRRWDSAYRCILQWSCAAGREQPQGQVPCPLQMPEVYHESSSVCPSFDSKPATDRDH
jgi:hypothetical protein